MRVRAGVAPDNNKKQNILKLYEQNVKYNS